MADKNVAIDIKIKADTGDLQKVADGLDQVGDSAQSATTKTTAGTGDATSKLREMAQAAESVGSKSGAVGKLGGALRTLSSAAGGPLAAIAALTVYLGSMAISAIRKFIQNVREAEKALREWNVETTRANAQAAVERLTSTAAAHDKLRAAIDKEHAALERLAGAYAAYDNAQKAAELAFLNMREKEELARIGTSGPMADVERARVSAEYAGKRRDIESAYDAKEVDAKVAAADRRVEAAERKLLDIKSQVTENAAAIPQLQQQLHELYAARRAISGGAAPMEKDYSWGGIWHIWSNFVDKLDATPRDRVNEEAQKGMLDEVAEKVKGVVEALSARKKTIEEGTERIEQADNELWALRAERSAAQVGQASFRATRPRLSAAEGTLADQALQEQERQAAQNMIQQRVNAFHTRIANRAVSTRAESDAFTVRRQDYPTEKAYDKAVKKDVSLETEARRLSQLANDVANFKTAVDKMPLDKIATALESFNQKMTSFERRLADINARARHQ